jgi:hypothetical protein
MVAANRLANLKWSIEKQRAAEKLLDEMEPPEVNWKPLAFVLTFIAGMLVGGWVR